MGYNRLHMPYSKEQAKAEIGNLVRDFQKNKTRR
jgi:hypothetical protein